MAAEKKGKSTIVIKKIYVTAGHHGGAWKVALADFMTALMAFFLVMWLIGQSDQTKKAVSDYFSTPSIIEYNFQNFGATITLEKLFLDFINSPIQAIQSFLEPINKTPNILDFGSQNMATAFLADQLKDILEPSNFLAMDSDGMQFSIEDRHFFIKGTASPNDQFIENSEKLKGVTNGLEDAIITIEVQLFNESVENSSPEKAQIIADERLRLLFNKIKGGLTSETVQIVPRVKILNKAGYQEGMPRPSGLIYFDVRQKPLKADGSKYQKLDRAFGKSAQDKDVYQNFINQIVESHSVDSKSIDSTNKE